MSLYLQTNSFRFFVAMERQNFPFCNQVTPFAYGYLNPGKPRQDWLSYITTVQNHRRMKQKRYNYVLQEDLHTNSNRVNWLSHYSSFCDHLVFEKFTMEASSWKSKITQFQFFFPDEIFQTFKNVFQKGLLASFVVATELNCAHIITTITPLANSKLEAGERNVLQKRMTCRNLDYVSNEFFGRESRS